MTSLAPIIIPTIAVIVTSVSLLVAYIAKREEDWMREKAEGFERTAAYHLKLFQMADRFADHWRNRAIDLSTQITEQKRLGSERTAKGNRTRAAKRRAGDGQAQ